jgi:hypothetical protein
MKLSAWWKAWSELVLKFLALAGSLASLIGVFLWFHPSLKNLPWWGIAHPFPGETFFIVPIALYDAVWHESCVHRC